MRFGWNGMDYSRIEGGDVAVAPGGFGVGGRG